MKLETADDVRALIVQATADAKKAAVAIGKNPQEAEEEALSVWEVAIRAGIAIPGLASIAIFALCGLLQWKEDRRKEAQELAARN